MKLHNNIKPIVVTTLAIGFFLCVKWQFPVYKVNSNTMLGDYPKGRYLLVSKFQQFQVGDVVVYKHKGNIGLSRVVGLEGNRLQGVDGDLTIDGKNLHFGSERYGYYVYCDSTLNVNDKVGYKELYPKREYFALLTLAEKLKLEQTQGVKKVVKQIHPTKGVAKITTGGSSSNWSRDNFGPIVLSSKNEVFLINDNRVNGMDSRSFGVIHRKDIVGKVLLKL